jgi:glycosyltransferase involved in cell wall biosynthesis
MRIIGGRAEQKPTTSGTAQRLRRYCWRSSHDQNPSPMMSDAETRRSMRLLHVIPSFAIGGVPVRLVNVANRLGRKYTHIVLALDGVTTAAERFAPDTDYALVDFAIDKRRQVRNLVRFRRAIAHIHPDLMLTYNWGAVDWAIANLPLPLCRHVHFEDGFGPDEFTGQLRRRILGRRYGLKRTERVVVPSRVLERIALEVWKLPAARVSFLANGVDLARFGAPPDRGLLAALGIAPDGPIVGTVAPLRPEKELGRLIRAFARLPAGLGARLVIVGDGAERARLTQEVDRLGIAARVCFAGATHAPERYLGLFDVFAMSSETEQMPISVLEAMAAGRPVASVDVGDVRAMLAPPNRPYVVAKRDDTLADAIAALLADRALREQIGTANREHARVHYDQDTMFRAHDLILQGRWSAPHSAPLAAAA